MKRRAFVLLIISAAISGGLYAQSHISTQTHQGSVNVIAPANYADARKTFFSAGEDGFLIKWTDDDQGEHYQISDLPIKSACASSDGKTVAVYETDGGLVNRVSVWDWNTLSRKYAVRFTDAVTSLSFSAGGTYLMAGTASVEGAYFIRADDGTILRDKIHDPTGVISYMFTSSTEKTVCMYSPAGSIAYYSMQTGKLKTKFSAEPGLVQVTGFAEDMFIAGIRDNTLYIMSALSGKTLASYSVSNAVILSSHADEHLWYFDTSSTGYVLNKIENFGGKTVSLKPSAVMSYKKIAGDAVCSGSMQGENILLGTRKGALYRISNTPSDSGTDSAMSLVPLTENIYDRILDQASSVTDFYFLTDTAIYESSYDNGIVNRKADNKDAQTKLSVFDDHRVILWSKGENKPVQLADLSTKEIKTLFVPKANIQTLRVVNASVIEMENNTTINVYHTDTGMLEEMYSGAALQDAAAIGNILYIAKSNATNPPSALISVDMTTKETAPLPVEGNVIYALSTDGAEKLYGIAVSSDDKGKSTKLFSFDIHSKSMTSISSVSTEDPEAFTYLSDDVIYTDLGRDKVRSLRTTGGNELQFNRSASLPLKVSRNGDRVVILNRDGSISWYSSTLGQVLADWYLTKDGNWFEF